MLEKNHDTYFDEQNADQGQDNLLKMIDDYSTKKELSLHQGQRVSGKIVSIGKEHLFVDIGAKNEACISKHDFTAEGGELTVAVGDSIEAFISSFTDDEIVLSKNISGQHKDAVNFVDLMQNKIPVQGKITGVNKGGFNVNVMGKRAFCPVSHIDLKYVDDPNVYLSRSLTFMVTRVTEGGRNIVLSRLPLLENELEAYIDQVIADIEKNRVYSGTVTRITDFGLFVDIGSIEGLVHISEVSWERAESLEAFNKGQKIDCIVLRVEKKDPLRNSKISLSIKQVFDNPWTTVSERLHFGDAVPGVITRIESFGAFVQLFPGVEGLIHVSELRWGERVRHPSEVVKSGDHVKVTIKSLDLEKRAVSCTLKDVADDPWLNIEQRFPVGSQFSATVVSKVKFGFFVDLAPGVTGLLALPNIASDKKTGVNVGAVLPVDVRAIDIETRRISLSYGVVEMQKNEEDTKAYMVKQSVEQKKPSSSEFGDLLKNALKKKLDK